MSASALPTSMTSNRSLTMCWDAETGYCCASVRSALAASDAL
jgi:hypothetical protein